MLTCGMDEVGRAAFAGPLVAAAVLPKVSLKKIGELLGSELRDAKTLSKLQHKKIVSKVSSLVHFKVSAITVEEINKFGLGWANQEIFRRLTKLLPAQKYIVDGNLKFGSGFEHLKSVIKADTKVPQVVLAGIFAKHFRDTYMQRLHLDFPHYNWLSNVGYGTRVHREAILTHGPCRYHRQIFLKKVIS